MNYKYSIGLLGLLFAFAACDKEEVITEQETNEVNEWIEQTMRKHYLWNDELPEKAQLNFGADPETFFNGLLSEKDGKVLNGAHHYFSILERAAATKSITDDKNSYGFDFAIADLKTKDQGVCKIAVVTYVLPASPAEEAGLRRGDWVLGVNGELGSIQSYDCLQSGAEASFYIADYDNEKRQFLNEHTLRIGASRKVEDTPFLKDSIYSVGGKKVGYLMYNRFASDPDGYKGTAYVKQMETLFAHFQQQGVSEFILDLRYNGGGLLSCAQKLASFLAPKSALGSVFCEETYNKQNKSSNRMVNLLRTTQVLAGNLNLNRLFILTGPSSASSSELVINGLTPYLGKENVRLIGRATLGKTVGMSIFDQSDKYGWILMPVTFRTYNAEGKADYADGFKPDVEIDEFKYDLAPFGEPADPLFAQAMQEITGLRASQALRPLPFALRSYPVRTEGSLIDDLPK